MPKHQEKIKQLMYGDDIDWELSLTGEGIKYPKTHQLYMKFEEAINYGIAVGREELKESIKAHDFQFFDAKTSLIVGNTILSQVGEQRFCIEANELINFLDEYVK